MKSLRPVVCVSLFALLLDGCRASEANQPLSLGARFDRNRLSAPFAPYAGNIEPGKFVVCTSKFSPAGLYLYSIEILDGVGADYSTPWIIQSNGQCDTALWTKRRGGPDPRIRITPSGSLEFITVDLWDYRSLIQGFVPGVGYKSVPLPDLTNGLEISGIDGAIAKFYYAPAKPPACQNPAGISPQSTCEAGNHGGTGTLDFDSY